MWIDAICINQNDLEERSSQVKIMSEIYKKAKKVVVWLGEDKYDHAQYAVELLNSISASPKNTWTELKKLSMNHPRMSEVLGECGRSAKHWRALKDLFSRTWFSRVWVIQEVAFCKDVLLLCGSHYLPWKSCINGCNFSTYSFVIYETAWESSYKGWLTEPMCLCRNFVKESKPIQLFVLLRDTRGFLATDSKDKIFAILGLSSLASGQLPATELIQIDYERTPTDVFIETARALVENSDDLMFLIEVEDSHLRQIIDLPSWVPDFSVTERPRIYFQSTKPNAHNGQRPVLNHLPDYRLLGIGAYRLGEIDDTAYWGVNYPFIAYLSGLITMLSEMDPVYISGEDRLGVLWRTLIQNGCDWISPAAAEVAHDFRNWLLSNIATAATEAYNSGSDKDQVNIVVNQLQTYSLSDPTGLMPSKQDIEDVIRQHQDGQPFEHAMSASKYNLELKYYEDMRPFKTDEGLLGLGAWSLRPGDSLWIIPGVCVPMVLRNTGTEDYFSVIGPAYVHGVMNGEALKGDRLQQRSIVLK